MEKIENFYNLFEVMPSASTNEILLSYENKITKYNNIKKLSKQQIYEIKMLKTGLYVLTNSNLRNKYNTIIKSISNNTTKTQTKETKKSKQQNMDKPSKTNNEPSAVNQTSDLTLDELFNVDNSWMNKIETPDNNINNRKSKLETNTLGDRIFSMSTYNKRPGFSSDREIELRKPQQGREDKSKLLLTNNN